jgi:hypothetical protein
MQRITRPLTDADRDERTTLLRGLREDDLCMRQHEREVYAEIAMHSRRCGLLDFKAEQERDRLVAESVAHMAGTGCRGHSCRQGRLPCRENCAEVAAAGVATAFAEPDDTSDGIAARGWRWVREFVSDWFDDIDARLHRI